jgi:hypothetical protein
VPSIFKMKLNAAICSQLITSEIGRAIRISATQFANLIVLPANPDLSSRSSVAVLPHPFFKLGRGTDSKHSKRQACVPKHQHLPCAREHSRGALPLEHDAKEVEARLAERDARDALDDRTPAERWLGDPPLWRSAQGALNA